MPVDTECKAFAVQKQQMLGLEKFVLKGYSYSKQHTVILLYNLTWCCCDGFGV